MCLYLVKTWLLTARLSNQMIHAHDGGNPQVPFYDKPSFVFLLNASLSDFFKNRTDP